MTLGAYRHGKVSWKPRFPGQCEVVSISKAAGARDRTAKAVKKTVQVVPRSHALVALGDSISFGWDLGNNWNPSPLAFPYLLGKAEHLPIDDLGYPGWTTSNLLQALSTKTYISALATASAVTIDIGNNDLLQPAVKDGLLGTNPPTALSSADLVSLELDVETMARNLSRILADVHRQAPSARVIVYNVYDPVAATNTVVARQPPPWPAPPTHLSLRTLRRPRCRWSMPTPPSRATNPLMGRRQTFTPPLRGKLSSPKSERRRCAQEESDDNA